MTKMNSIFRCLSVLALVISCQNASAQLSSLYAQFGFNPLPLNPAVAGYHGNFTASLSNRTSFNKTEGMPFTQFFTIHTPLGKKGWVGGLEVINDKAGLMRNLHVSGIGGYQIKMKESTLTAALKGGLSSFNTLWSQSITSTVNDPTIYGDEKRSSINATGGLYYQDTRTSLGISQSTNSDFQINSRGFVAHGAYIIGNKQNSYWQPAFALRYNRNSEMMADVNLTFNNDRYGSFGISLRSNDSFGIFTRIVFNQQLWSTISMDFYGKRIPGTFRNTLEIALNYDLRRRSTSPNPLIF